MIVKALRPQCGKRWQYSCRRSSKGGRSFSKLSGRRLHCLLIWTCCRTGPEGIRSTSNLSIVSHKLRPMSPMGTLRCGDTKLVSSVWVSAEMFVILCVTSDMRKLQKVKYYRKQSQVIVLGIRTHKPIKVFKVLKSKSCGLCMNPSNNYRKKKAMKQAWRDHIAWTTNRGWVSGIPQSEHGLIYQDRSTQ